MPKIPSYSFRGQSEKPPSKDSCVGNAFAAAPKVYTGHSMIGIAQLHKSNAVPVFQQEDVVAVANMRR
jgi:hypothetical protein